MTDEQNEILARQLKHMKLQTALLALMLVITLLVGAFLVIQVSSVMQQVENLDLQKINDTIGSLETVAGELEKLDMDAINDGIRSLSNAAKVMSEVDIDAVNDGIQSLSSAGEKLRELDMEKLNDLMVSLEKVVSQMEKTTAAFAKIFGR